MGFRDGLRYSRLAKALSRKGPTDQEISLAIQERTPPAVRSLLTSLGTDFGEMLRKEPRSIIPEVITTYGFLQEPPYDPFTLQRVAQMHWVVRTCIAKLVRESTRKGYHWEPRFESYCEACETEYDYTPSSAACPECQATGLSKPDAQQLVACKEFLEHPNPEDSFLDILKRNATDLLTFDDFYVGTAISKSTGAAKLEIWPEDARYMRIEADLKGRLGGRTFCPVSEDRKILGTATKLYAPEGFPPGTTCPENDGGVLKSMAYAQTLGGEVKAAFGTDDMLHDNLFATSSRLYGTPKIWAVQTQLAAMMLIDTYQKDSFEKAKTPKNIIIYRGFSDSDLRRIQKQNEEAKKLNAMADLHIPIPTQYSLSGKAAANTGVEVIRGIDTPLIQGSIEFQRFYFEAICYAFGVDPASIGVATPGRLGNTDANVTGGGAAQEAAQELQVQLGEAWDRFLKSKFSEIKDWKFTLETAYEQEENDLWTIKKLKMETAKIAVDAGFDVRIDETGDPKITGVAKPPQLLSPFGTSPKPFGGETRATNVSSVETRATSVEKGNDDIEKASIWQRDLVQAAIDYKERLDQVAGFVFGRLMQDLNNYVGPGPVERVTADLRDTIVSRSRKVLEMASQDVGPVLEQAAKALYVYGKNLGTRDVQHIAKQEFNTVFDEEDSAAVEAFYSRTQDAMKNTLYLGDRDTYLSRIKDITQECIEAGGCTTVILARKLAAQLDPEQNHFSDYMWERLARTETAAYVSAGRLKAYEEFGVPLVRRIVTVDSRTDPVRCLPFVNAVYKVDDSYEVIPAHVNCRCAWAPYFGPEEPLSEGDILYAE